MTQLSVDSEEVKFAFDQSLESLNMRSDSLQPFTLEKIESATKGADGRITIMCQLKMFDMNHHFRLVFDKNVAFPESLVDFEQLEQ